MSPQYPEYFHIGLPKTGTTSIQYLLEKDQRINLIFKSGFFTTTDFWTSVYDFYDAEKQVNIESDETMVRGFSNYGKFVLNLEHIAQKAPNAQIIITIREQIQLMESRYKDTLNSVYYDGTFEDWLTCTQGLDYISFCHFSLLYKTVKLFFPKEHIHFLFFEDLKNNNTQFFQDLYQIFDLPPPSDISFDVHKNKSPNFQDLELHRRTNKYFGLSVKRKYSEWVKPYAYSMVKLLTPEQRTKNHKLWKSGTLYENLEKAFKASNRELIAQGILSESKLKKYGYLI